VPTVKKAKQMACGSRCAMFHAMRGKHTATARYVRDCAGTRKQQLCSITAGRLMIGGNVTGRIGCEVENGSKKNIQAAYA